MNDGACRCDVLLVYSSQGADYAKRIGFPPERCLVAVNVVDTVKAAEAAAPYFKERERLTLELTHSAAPVVIYVGTLAAGKGLNDFLACARRLQLASMTSGSL